MCTRKFFMGKLFSFSSVLRGMFLVFLLCGLAGNVSAQTAALPEEALVDLVKPSVVRIAEHVTGTAKIPEVKVDIRQHLVAMVPGAFTEVPIDEYLSGSGFIIHPDGYIATNAHVVSQETVKQSLASEKALSALFENALFLSDEEFRNFLESEEGDRFGKQVLKYVIDHSVFDLKNEISVLRPGSEKTKIADLITDGFPAEVLLVNDRFIDDERDVALIKIKEIGLPVLQLGQSEELAVGKKSFIFGFPATAEVNSNNSAEATFTQGVVSAIKQSSDKSLRIFQTDAKVSEGSSGGPLLNDRGEVVGIITFQTGGFDQASGDNFAFALPVDIVKDVADDARLSLEESVYGKNFKAGFFEYSAKHCERAEVFFAAAIDSLHPGFGAEERIAPYRNHCEALRRSGMSLDSRWDTARAKVGDLGNPFLYLLGGSLLVFGIFGAALFWILRQVRREGREIEALEERLRADEVRIHSYKGGNIVWERSVPEKSLKKRVI